MTADDIAKLRKGIAQVLGTGLPRNSIVFAQDPWSKGYCAGVTAALTGFDDALRALAERPHDAASPSDVRVDKAGEERSDTPKEGA